MSAAPLANVTIELTFPSPPRNISPAPDHATHDQATGPNVPFAGIGFHGVPLPSIVVLWTVFPHQFTDIPGKMTAKKMITAETASPESSAADNT
jgi:hypothetical protein